MKQVDTQRVRLKRDKQASDERGRQSENGGYKFAQAGIPVGESREPSTPKLLHFEVVLKTFLVIFCSVLMLDKLLVFANILLEWQNVSPLVLKLKLKI